MPAPKLTPVYPEYRRYHPSYIHSRCRQCFYHGDSTGVTHAETFTRAAWAYRRPPVAPYRQVLPIMLAYGCGRLSQPEDEWRLSRPPCFTDIVVGITGQVQFHAARVPTPKLWPAVPLKYALIGSAATPDRRASGRYSLKAMRRQNGGVADIEPEGFALAFIDKRFCCCSNCAFSRPLSNGGLFSVRRALYQDAAQQSPAASTVPVLLFGGETVQLFQQVGATNQITRRVTPSCAISSRVSRAIN